MIRIRFTEPETTSWRTWRTRCQTETEQLVAAVERGEPFTITALYKAQKSVYMQRKGPFGGKCAYCESLIAADQPGDIEHYRPKNEVTDEDGSSVTVVGEDGTEQRHPGYYWLAYDWRNLLPACADCNRSRTLQPSGRRIGKWTCFPVREYRAVRPGDEAKEDPLILHPVVEEPGEYLEIDSTGVLSATAESDKGKTCIRVFGLNDREALVEARCTAYRESKAKLVRLAEACYHSSEDAMHLLADIKRIRAGKCPYAVAARKGLDESINLLKPIRDILVKVDEHGRH